jgi:hypothetical protein
VPDVVSTLPDPPADDMPVSPELVEERDVVRKLEAQMAAEHGVDTPAYWRAMSEQLNQYVADDRFRPVDGTSRTAAATRAHGWLLRVAAGYRALAATSIGS